MHHEANQGAIDGCTWQHRLRSKHRRRHLPLQPSGCSAHPLPSRPPFGSPQGHAIGQPAGHNTAASAGRNLLPGPLLHKRHHAKTRNLRALPTCAMTLAAKGTCRHVKNRHLRPAYLRHDLGHKVGGGAGNAATQDGRLAAGRRQGGRQGGTAEHGSSRELSHKEYNGRRPGWPPGRGAAGEAGRVGLNWSSSSTRQQQGGVRLAVLQDGRPGRGVGSSRDRVHHAERQATAGVHCGGAAAQGYAPTPCMGRQQPAARILQPWQR